MKTEWQTYWRKMRLSLRGYLLAVGVSLVFYLFAIPRLHGTEQHAKYLLLSLLFGVVIFTWIWALYCIQWAILVRQKIAHAREYKISWPTHILISFTGTTFGLLSALYLESKITGIPFSPGQLWESLLISLFISMMFQFYYAYKHSNQENMQLKASKAESDLHILRTQMQPHFLFNSLNSLAALIEQNPATAGAATQKLADLYRLILECSKSQLAPLCKEIQIAELYLAIEQIRFGGRLAFEPFELSTEFQNIMVPSLLIQTLVENAVKHGIAGSMKGGFIGLRARKSTEGLHMEVLNSGAPLREIAESGTGIKNTKERLNLIFGSAHQFRLAVDSQGFTCASFLIPGV